MKNAARVFMTCATALVLFAMVDASLAKRSEDGRSEFRGIIVSRPENTLHGEWLIGGRVVLTDARTEFDQAEGPLDPGTCAKVKIRNGRIHEIDSEPMSSCQ